VPPVNVCVVDADRLYPSLLAALHGERWQQAMPANLIFVSGPSKTADIQQTLAYGAHGPKELVVLVECDTPPAGES
jgi:L-lactate dehydrogenase complex protein LldG